MFIFGARALFARQQRQHEDIDHLDVIGVQVLRNNRLDQQELRVSWGCPSNRAQDLDGIRPDRRLCDGIAHRDESVAGLERSGPLAVISLSTVQATD